MIEFDVWCFVTTFELFRWDKAHFCWGIFVNKTVKKKWQNKKTLIIIFLDRKYRSASWELTLQCSYMNSLTLFQKSELVMSALDLILMNFIVFYKPSLTVTSDIDSVCLLSAISYSNRGLTLLQNSKLCESWKYSWAEDHDMCSRLLL